MSITIYILFGLLFIFWLTSLYIIKNLLFKISVYEQWILKFKSDVQLTLEKMDNIDKSGLLSTSMNEQGIFQHDDDVGFIFKELKNVLEELNKISE